MNDRNKAGRFIPGGAGGSGTVYPADLTRAEWARVTIAAAIIAHSGPLAFPESVVASRARAIVDAIYGDAAT